MATNSIASPKSTGGDGNHYETQVNAYWLLLMAKCAAHPSLGIIQKVRFQTAQFGWRTDDTLVESSDSSTKRRMLCQVKNRLVISKNKQNEGYATLAAFLDDYLNTEFDHNLDSFAIITRHMTQSLDSLKSLLVLSKASSDYADFVQSLSTPGRINKKAHEQHGVVKEVVRARCSSVADNDVGVMTWRLLRSIKLIDMNLDIDGGYRTAVAHLLSDLCSNSPENVWSQFIRLAAESKRRGATLTRTDLPPHLQLIKNTTGHRELPSGPMYFCGREEILQEIDEKLAPGKCIAITGLAGVGKTALAIEYARTRMTDGRLKNVFFLSFENAETATRTYTNLADLLPVDVGPSATESQRFFAVKRWLENNHSLLIVDNLDLSAWTSGVRKPSDFWDSDMTVVLATTRDAAVWSDAVAVRLPPLNGPAATKLLNYYHQGQEQDLQAIAERCGGLPLALHIVGSYLEGTKRPPGQIAAQLEDHSIEFFNKPIHGLQLRKPIMSVLETSFAQVRSIEPKAIELLGLFAFWGSSEIPLDLWGSDSAHRASGYCRDELDYLVQVLRRASLVQRDEVGSVSCHRLIQSYTRWQMSVEATDESIAVSMKVLDAIFPMRPEEPESWPTIRRIAGHLHALSNHARAMFPGQEAEVKERWALYLRVQGETETAEGILRNTISTMKEVYGPFSIQVAVSQRRLASVVCHTQPSNCIALLRSALAFHTDALETPDVEFEIIDNLSSAPIELGRCIRWVAFWHTNRKDIRSLELYQCARAIFEEHYGLDSPEAAALINDLAMCMENFSQTNRKYWKKAPKLQEQSLEMMERLKGPNHPHTANQLNNMAVALQNRGRPKDAEPLLRRALRITGGTHGTDNPLFQHRLTTLGDCLYEQQRIDDAIELWRRALRVPKFGRGGLAVADLHFRLSKVLCERQSWHGALEHAELAEQLYDTLTKEFPTWRQHNQQNLNLARRMCGFTV